jgi:DNA-binding MarR family transcriptional regulator
MRRDDARAEREGPGEAVDARVAWQRLLRVSSRVTREFDRRLEDEHRISVREFDVLITLDTEDGGGLRMTDLANAVMLSSGGLTRLVGRLEERGLVRREPDAADARAFHALLTESGRARLAEARVTHDAVIAELLGAQLSAAEVETLSRLLGGLLEQRARVAAPPVSGRRRARRAAPGASSSSS